MFFSKDRGWYQWKSAICKFGENIIFLKIGRGIALQSIFLMIILILLEAFNDLIISLSNYCIFVFTNSKNVASRSHCLFEPDLTFAFEILAAATFEY